MRPLKYRFRGGGYQLNADARASYFWRCKKIYCSKEANDKFSNNIRKNMKIIFKATKRVLNEAPIGAQDKDILKEKLQRIKSEYKGYTLTALNIKSLQCVLLMTIICKIKNPEKSTMNKYPIPTIKNEYNILTNYQYHTWDDYNYIYNQISQNRELSLYKRLIGKKYENTDYCCPDLSSARILVLLGELTLLELVDTMADNIYLIGVTTDFEWADGREFTPLEFLHHDLIHAENRETGFGDFGMGVLPLERSFIDHVKANPDSYDLDKIMLPMFLLMHEIPMAEVFLTSPYIYELNYEYIEGTVVGELKNWRNVHMYGGLVPEEIRKGTDKEIIAYLNECFKLFKNAWNNFFNPALAAAAGAGGAAAGNAAAGAGSAAAGNAAPAAAAPAAAAPTAAAEEYFEAMPPLINLPNYSVPVSTKPKKKCGPGGCTLMGGRKKCTRKTRRRRRKH